VIDWNGSGFVRGLGYFFFLIPHFFPHRPDFFLIIQQIFLSQLSDFFFEKNNKFFLQAKTKFSAAGRLIESSITTTNNCTTRRGS